MQTPFPPISFLAFFAKSSSSHCYLTKKAKRRLYSLLHPPVDIHPTRHFAWAQKRENDANSAKAPHPPIMRWPKSTATNCAKIATIAHTQFVATPFGRSIHWIVGKKRNHAEAIGNGYPIVGPN
jgi:hypothetical protein